jgi:PKHD-type hydroxylase
LQSIKIQFPYATSNDLFSETELQEIEKLMNNKPLQDAALYNADGTLNTKSSYRKSKLHFLRTENQEYSWILDKISMAFDRFNSEFFHLDIYGYEFAQYAEYLAKDGGHYDWHVDLALGGGAQETLHHDGMHRKLSMSVLLNDNFSGGEFQVTFNGGSSEITIPLVRGSVLVFPSFICHRVKPVTDGVRKSLVAWMLGPRFR